MIEVSIFIPIKDNSGKDFPKSPSKLFRKQLNADFGGFTVLSKAAYGEWVEGEVYSDTHDAYIVRVSGMLSGAERLLAAVALAKTQFRQLGIYVRYLGVSEIL